jgi:hypothetical protein
LPSHVLPLADFEIEALQKSDVVLFHVTHTPHASWQRFAEVASAQIAQVIFVIHTDLEHSEFNSLATWPERLRLKFIEHAYKCAGRSARVAVFTSHQKSQLAWLSSIEAVVAPMPMFCNFEMSPTPIVANKRLLIMGERNIIKGYDRFIKFANLSPELDFLSVGSGDIKCAELPTSRLLEIETLPYRQSLSLLFDTRALLIFSRSESWGRTILEAFLFRKPVLAFEPVGVLKQMPSEWIGHIALSSQRADPTGMSEFTLSTTITALDRAADERRDWTLEKNLGYQAIWLNIIQSSVR